MAGQTAQNIRVKNKTAPNMLSLAKRATQGGVIMTS
jgi:hypothetical protein